MKETSETGETSGTFNCNKINIIYSHTTTSHQYTIQLYYDLLNLN
jgi:hypothetical protein